MNTLTAPPRKPWYREPWPWFLMALPASAVVAGLTTVWIAFSNYDGLVVGDYYKAGLAINQTLARDDAAYALGLAAAFHKEDDALTVTLTGKLKTWPERLTLTLAHPTHQGFDQTVTLHHAGGGHYRAQMPALHAGKWHAEITDAASTWRLAGAVHAPFDQVSTLTASTVHQPQGD